MGKAILKKTRTNTPNAPNPFPFFFNHKQNEIPWIPANKANNKNT
jgi:hypothetical protein